MLRIILLSLALLSPSYGMVRFRKVSRHHENIDINQAVDEGIANFGVNLNKQLTQRAQQGENVIFSPIGIYLSLALGHLGANGQTRDEIGDVLGLPKESEWASKVHENLGEIIKRLQSQSNSNVTIANGMFVQNGCKVKDTFKQQLQSYYNHKVSNVDFNSGDATDKVNRWFSDNTRGKIENFYNDNIERDTKVLLANALCFNGNWENNFPSEQTKQETFKTEDGRQQRINMMQKTENVQYCDNQQDKYEAIGIPYKQNEYKLYLVLPREGQSLRDLANVFSSQHIQQIVSGSGSDCTQTTVDIKMPQMRLRTTHKIKDMLQEMGVRQLFESADLSNMADQWKVKVNQVSHSIDLNVNEEGTDVCAGTAQEYKIRERQMIDEEASRQFYVQKPYMFFIYHPSTKAVICYGNVNQLSE